MCTLENLLHRVYQHLRLCILWKTYCIVCTVENLLHRVYRGKLTASCVTWKTYCIVCTVENLFTSSCIIYRGKLTDKNTFRKHHIDIMCTMENLLTSSCIMYRGKLTLIVCNIKMIITCLINPTRTYSYFKFELALLATNIMGDLSPPMYSCTLSKYDL